MNTQESAQQPGVRSSASAQTSSPSADGQKQGEHSSRSRHCHDGDDGGRHFGHRRHRRGGFFFALIVGLVAGAVGGYIGKSFAQGGPSHYGHFGHFGMHRASASADPARMNEGIDRMVRHFAVETDASPAQQEKLSAIVKSAAADMAPIHDKLQAARKQAIELMKGDKVDRAAIERLRIEQVQLADTVSKRITLALGDAAEVLTPQQRQKVAGRLEQWMSWADRMGGRRGGWMGGAGNVAKTS